MSELSPNPRPTSWQIFVAYLRVVAGFSWIATKYGCAVIVVLLAIGSLVAQRSLFTPEHLRRFVLPLLVYNGSLFFLALPYLVFRDLKNRDQR